jgi:hypothetical protein
MDKLFQRLLADRFSELPGLTVNASIPVPEHLVNEFIEIAIRETRNISYCRVSISRGNRASMNIKTPLWPWPLELKLRLEDSPDFAALPIIHARLENQVLLAKIGAFLKALPAGISIQGNRVDVDVSSFLNADQRRLLELIKSIEIKTEAATLILEVTIGNEVSK